MRSRVALGWPMAGLLALTLAGCVRMAEREEPRPASASGCDEVPTTAELKRLLRDAPAQGGEAGGLNHGQNVWAAVVDRNGQVCAIAASPLDEWAAWAGSRAVAMEKAFSANAFSTPAAPLSTARLFTLAQPGHSFFGVENANPVNPDCLYTLGGPEAGVGKVCGGTITFAGGVPLYRGQSRVGGLGVSGDTSCADHEIAKRVRAAAGLNPPGGAAADDILYTAVDGPSAFVHPLCLNTWRNGTKIGDELPAAGY